MGSDNHQPAIGPQVDEIGPEVPRSLLVRRGCRVGNRGCRSSRGRRRLIFRHAADVENEVLDFFILCPARVFSGHLAPAIADHTEQFLVESVRQTLADRSSPPGSGPYPWQHRSCHFRFRHGTERNPSCTGPSLSPAIGVSLTLWGRCRLLRGAGVERNDENHDHCGNEQKRLQHDTSPQLQVSGNGIWQLLS